PILFAEAKALAFEVTERSPGPSQVALEGRPSGEVLALEQRIDTSGRPYSSERKSALRYTVWSADPRPTDGVLDSLPAAPSLAPPRPPYPELRTDLPPGVAELARGIPRDAHGPYAKARAVEQSLASHYPYTLDLRRDDRYEPIDDFLFVTRAGH